MYQRHIGTTEGLVRFAWTCVVAGIAGIFIVVGWLLWSLTGETAVTLNPAKMKIQRLVLGIEWDTRIFATCDVHNLRYIAPTSMWYRNEPDPNSSKIQFQENGKKRRFAGGITEKEACALIDRMLEVYKFPKESAVETIKVAG